MSARLCDLRPELSQAGGAPLMLSFDCPNCGAPYRICVPVDWQGVSPIENTAYWKMSGCGPDPAEFSWEKITLSPSINNHHHGRKKQCTWHGHIAAGAIKP